MNEKYIQILGIAIITVYAVLIIFLYASQPASLEDLTIKAQQAVDNTLSKGQVITGTYQIDQTRFNEALAAFRTENYIRARDDFQKADPEQRDAATQFYIAYSFYRQGWGRISSDDALFKAGLESLTRVSMLDKDYSAKDPDLKLRTPAELKAEMEAGLEISAEDFNPFKLFRERK